MVMTYSKSADGNTKLSEHFKVKEFACKDGSDIVLIDDRLVMLLEQVRCYFGQPVIINSAYRTETHNKNVGGSPTSKHKYGLAADIRIPGVTPRQVYDFFNRSLPGSCGLGLYSTFVHIDTRSEKKRWCK